MHTTDAQTFVMRYRYICTCLLFIQVYLIDAYKVSLHPVCNRKFDFYIEDLTALLHGNELPSSTCVFNPAVVHLHSNLYLWAARTYAPALESVFCLESIEVSRPPLNTDRWLGQNFLVLAVTTAVWNSGSLKLKLLGYLQVDIPIEDPRVFKDANGTAWVLMHVKRGASLMTVAEVTTECSRSNAADMQCKISMGATRVLWFTRMNKIDKNWVPHNGTARMTYPVFPTFAPHSVFDWGSYHNPAVKREFDSEAPMDPFFEGFRDSYGKLLEFSGSTPAILYDDEVSYVAVGHIRAHGHCFHNNGVTTATCWEYASANTSREMTPIRLVHHDRTHAHFIKEYAMFLYRFSATPPYNITHISHAFMPCSLYHHSGIIFPTGLERIGPNRDYLITYGEADRYSRILVMPVQAFRELLQPIDIMRTAVTNYSLCTLPCGLSRQ